MGSADWGDRTVVLIGGGPSVKGHDLSTLRDLHVVALKATIFQFSSWAEVGFGLDSIDLRRWWRELKYIKMPIYWPVSERWAEKKAKQPIPRCLRPLRRSSLGTKLSDDPEFITGGGTSGFAALNFAYLKGAKRIVLFGYDYGSIDGEWHADGSKYDPKQSYIESNWVNWAEAFNDALPQLREKGIEVINASINSRIEAFEKVTVSEGMRRCLK